MAETNNGSVVLYDPHCADVEKFDLKKEMRSMAWKNDDEISLAEKKRDEHKRCMIDRNFKMTPAQVKWEYIAAEFEKEGKSYSAVSIEKKWKNIMSDFKKIFHYQSKSGAKSWWNMYDINEKKQTDLKLNKISFSEELFVIVASFMGDRPAVNGCHVIQSGEKRKLDPDEHDEHSTLKFRRKKVKEEKQEDNVSTFIQLL